MKYYHNYGSSTYNDGIPEHIRDSFERYLMHGLEPGGFVTAVLANDLFLAVSRADAINVTKIPHIALWVYHNMPAGSIGSYDIVRDWIKDVDNIRTNYSEKKKKELFYEVMENPN